MEHTAALLFVRRLFEHDGDCRACGPDGTLVASPEVSGELVASNGERPEKDYVRQQ